MEKNSTSSRNKKPTDAADAPKPPNKQVKLADETGATKHPKMNKAAE